MQDLDALLVALSEEAPAGVDLRLSATDASLSEIRQRQRELGRGQEEVGPGDWKSLAQLCEKTLGESTKDLEVAFYLTQAWARVEGIAGVEAGLALVVGLCERYWDVLHPGSEGEGIDLDLRASPISALGGTDMLRAVSQSSLLSAPNRDEPLCWEDFTYSQIVDRHSGGAKEGKKKHEELVAAGRMNGVQWREALRAAGGEALGATCAQLRRCEDSLRALRQIVDKYWGCEDAPTVTPLEALLSDIREHLELQLPQRETSGGTEATPMQESSVATEAPTGPAPFGAIRNREEALRQLALIGDYFRQTEPHSPLAAICSRAVRWGRMPFEQVLLEVVEDEGVLAKLWNAVGVRPESKGS